MIFEEVLRAGMAQGGKRGQTCFGEENPWEPALKELDVFRHLEPAVLGPKVAVGFLVSSSPLQEVRCKVVERTLAWACFNGP